MGVRAPPPLGIIAVGCGIASLVAGLMVRTTLSVVPSAPAVAPSAPS